MSQRFDTLLKEVMGFIAKIRCGDATLDQLEEHLSKVQVTPKSVLYHPIHGDKSVPTSEVAKLCKEGWYTTPANFPVVEEEDEAADDTEDEEVDEDPDEEDEPTEDEPTEDEDPIEGLAREQRLKCEDKLKNSPWGLSLASLIEGVLGENKKDPRNKEKYKPLFDKVIEHYGDRVKEIERQNCMIWKFKE